MKRSFPVLLSFMGGITITAIIFSQLSFNEKTSREKEIQRAIEMNPWHAPQIPDEMNFAGERVPLERWEVREQFDRELLYNYYAASNILYMLKLANRYFPMIQERLKAHGLPDDFKYLCVAESNLMNAISKAGAVGFWQFMPKSGPEYSLEVNSSVDERYNVLKSTDAACNYLKDAYKKFGSWTAAAASYNCGMGGYNAQATYQGSTNYYDLLLPEETQRYIFRILAFKHLMANADQLGYKLAQDELYEPVKTKNITVSSSIPNLAAFAKQNGTSYKMLKWLNPWLRGKSLSVRAGKEYIIRLPA